MGNLWVIVGRMTRTLAPKEGQFVDFGDIVGRPWSQNQLQLIAAERRAAADCSLGT